jgi:hypothetical protein
MDTFQPQGLTARKRAQGGVPRTGRRLHLSWPGAALEDDGVRHSIGTRLFLAMVAAIGVLALTGGALIRWTLRDDRATDEEARAREPLEGLEALLGAKYRHHDWSFLPAEAAGQRALLREAVYSCQRLRTRVPLRTTRGWSTSAPRR